MGVKKQDDIKQTNERRRFLVNATAMMSLVGVGGLAIPFVASMSPSAKARTGAAPIKVDISRLQPGEQITVLWQSKPVWLLRRTADSLKRLNQPLLLKKLRDPESAVLSQQPDYARNEVRSIKSEYLVVVALCTHLGCVPTYRPELGPADLGPDWPGGYYCPCHGSLFDLAGRVYKGVPAPTNLVIPPYQFLSDTVVEVGTSKET